tara:strand:+ start:424 stop:1092 length:669 start_codon:yes stop_codon:yes gene_type:complete
MPTVYANTSDGSQASRLLATWNDTHDHIGVGSPGTTNATHTMNGARYEYVTGRGAPRYYLVRSFFDFDTSGISSAPSAATFKLKAFSQNTCTPCIIAKSGHDPSTTSDDWFSTWITGQGVTLSGWGASDITAYSSSTTINSVGSYTDFTLNSDALSDMASLSTFKICLLHNNDYNDVAPTSGLLRTGLYFADASDAADRPYIDYTEATVSTTDNAIFFGSNF